MIKKPAEQIKVGDVIMPPARELSLWMRRHIKEHGMSEAALHLTVVAVVEGAPDKNGRWLIVRTTQSDEWCVEMSSGRMRPLFNFKVRPASPWSIVSEVAN